MPWQMWGPSATVVINVGIAVLYWRTLRRDERVLAEVDARIAHLGRETVKFLLTRGQQTELEALRLARREILAMDVSVKGPAATLIAVRERLASLPCLEDQEVIIEGLLSE